MVFRAPKGITICEDEHMKKTITVYTCDHCGKEFGDEPHLSMSFKDHSGWVFKDKGIWYHRQRLTSGIKHFCNEKCLSVFFNRSSNKGIDPLLTPIQEHQGSDCD